ncbi:gamma-glutamylcyclotransferase [Rhodobacteraceae bacterium WD3A24]|nr:gamma-glutamylcyclotransferase [Rhodobacteraceae bacterium WD3A24]
MRDDPLWVFGYGSLIWNPGFEHLERRIAWLDGWHRSFCMRSIHHRGTPDRPGLVLALDAWPGARCTGVAFAVERAREAETLDYLRERELVSAAYFETRQPITLDDGREVTGVTYVIDPDHDQYCGGLPLEEQASIIARAHGGRGPNPDYLLSTAAHLEELGIADDDMRWLAGRVRRLTAQQKG